MRWTDEKTKLLKDMWLKGLSPNQIAAKLGGGVTRNAVIDKVHRLGLSGRATPKRKPARSKRVPAPKKTLPPSPPAKRSREPHPEPLPPIIDWVELVIPEGERATIDDIDDGNCHWPIGDPKEPDFHFCGRQTKGRKFYCEFHSSKAHQPARRPGTRKKRATEQRLLISVR